MCASAPGVAARAAAKHLSIVWVLVSIRSRRCCRRRRLTPRCAFRGAHHESLQDLRFAVRLLVKDRWFTVVAAMALALGIGVNTAVFTFVNAVLIRGLPFDDPDRIIVVGTTDARDRQLGVSRLDFKDWRDSSRSFAGLAIFIGATMNVSDEGRAPERFQGAYLSANLFQLIGSAPVARPRLPAGRRPPGRGAGGHPRRRHLEEPLRQRPGVIGRTIKVNSVAVDRHRDDAARLQVSVQHGYLAAASVQCRPEARERSATCATSRSIGRLAPGVTLAAGAGRDSDDREQRSRTTIPETNKDITPAVVTFNERVTGGRRSS